MQLAKAHTQDDWVDTTWLNLNVAVSCCLHLQPQIGPHQAIYEVVALFLRDQSVWAALMCFYAIAAKYIAQLAAAHTQDDKIDTTWLNVGMYCCLQPQIQIRIGPHQAIYEVVASFLRDQSD